MKSIAFIDVEINPDKRKITDIGGINSNGNHFHSGSIENFSTFLKSNEFICGHNIIKHDLRYLKQMLTDLDNIKVIDTLYLSPLLFPNRPYHALLKADKLQSEELNNPLNDAIKARDLFFDEIAAFHELNHSIKAIMFCLLNNVVNSENSGLNEKLSVDRKHIYKFILSPFSFESSHHFNKIHKRKFNSFGCIHELRKLPGAMM